MNDKDRTQESEEELNQLISFTVGSEEYGLEIGRVKEVIRTPEITRLPKAPSFVKGIINLRGDVIPVVDLRDKFGFAASENSGKTRIIVVDVGGRLIGLIVDAASQVIAIPADQIEPPPPLAGGLPRELIVGVGKLGDRLIILLNIDSVLSTKDRIGIEGTMQSDAAPEREDVPAT